jgi:hypothetical protein
MYTCEISGFLIKALVLKWYDTTNMKDDFQHPVNKIPILSEDTQAVEIEHKGPVVDGRAVTAKKKREFTKKEKLIAVGGAAVVVLILGTGSYFAFFHKSPKPVVKTASVLVKVSKVTPTPTATTIVSRLTGDPVTAAQSTLPVTAVMIENSLQARPQSGLGEAGVVFEALAEGGITRFVALYEEETPSSIGPVRSARPYFIDWMLPFDAAYAHDGGSPTGLADITADNVRDMNEQYNGSSYFRISSRESPHNLYTNMTLLQSLETAKGWTSSTFTGFPRKAAAPSKTPTATTINMNISGSDYDVFYKYNPATNTYERSEGGGVQIDADTGQQINPNVVISMVVPWTDGALDTSDAYYTDYSDIGTGQATIFQDGTVTVGTWSKSSPTSQIQFLNGSGQPIALDPGQTWITAIGSASELGYTD